MDLEKQIVISDSTAVNRYVCNLVFDLRQIASVGTVSNEVAATAFRIATLMALFTCLRSTVLHSIISATSRTKNEFQNHAANLAITPV